jgi:predicted dehydrogenase
MPESKLRILVIGTGSIGERHVRCFMATGRADIGICEINPELRETVAKRYNLKEVYGDLSLALTKSWNAVLVATPAHTHIPIATEVARAGIHLLIEKPLSTSLDGIDELQRIIKKKKLIAAVSYNHRAHPGAEALKAALDSGRFGKPLQLYMASGQHFPFYRPAYRDIYFADPKQGGGAIQDSITHTLNLAEWLLGPITRLVVDAAHQYLDGVSVEDTVHIIARHGDVMATYATNMYQAPNESFLTVVCEKGTVRFELHKKRLRVMMQVEGTWEESLHELPDRDAWYVRNANCFLDVLEGKCEPLCTLAEGLQTLRVNLAALRSVEKRAWQNIGED